MFEAELLGREVALLRSSLRYRVLEITDKRRAIYERLISELRGVGLYQFNALEAACLVLALMDFAAVADQVGHHHLTHQAQQLGSEFYELAFGTPLTKAFVTSSWSIPQELAVLVGAG